MDSSLATKILTAFTHFPVELHLLYVAEVGSTAYNLRLPESGDRDLFAVVLPPPRFALGLQPWDECQVKTDDLDMKFYSLRKYCQLLMKGNPNVLETLWVNPEQQLSVDPDFRKAFLNHRACFSSLQAAKAMAGYASSQLGRMESGQCEALGASRKALVDQMGYDTKIASHALRILAMGEEFVKDGILRVWRTEDAENLRNVKAGRVPLGLVKEQGERLFAAFNAARAGSPLREVPNPKVMEALLLDLTRVHWRRAGLL